MKTRGALAASLTVMALFIAVAIAFPHEVTAVLGAHPELYLDAKLAHILSATLFFGNVVIGTIWETRSLVSRKVGVIRHTYETVAALDAFFTAPLILVALTSGMMLATFLGGPFSMGWLTLAFGLFVLSGLVWVVVDIPTQRGIKRIFATLPDDAGEAPPELLRLLRFRLGLNLFAIVPLLVVFFLMVRKPEVPGFRGVGGERGGRLGRVEAPVDPDRFVDVGQASLRKSDASVDFGVQSILVVEACMLDGVRCVRDDQACIGFRDQDLRLAQACILDALQSVRFVV